MSGFYKNDNGQLLYAEKAVYNNAFVLLAESYQSYNYPVDGWYWFDSEEEARVFFNLDKPKTEDNNDVI